MATPTAQGDRQGRSGGGTATKTNAADKERLDLPVAVVGFAYNALQIPTEFSPAPPSVPPVWTPPTIPNHGLPAANQPAFAPQAGAATVAGLAVSPWGMFLAFVGGMLYSPKLGNGELTAEQREVIFGTSVNEDGKVATFPKDGKGVVRDADGEHEDSPQPQQGSDGAGSQSSPPQTPGNRPVFQPEGKVGGGTSPSPGGSPTSPTNIESPTPETLHTVTWRKTNVVNPSVAHVVPNPAYDAAAQVGIKGGTVASEAERFGHMFLDDKDVLNTTLKTIKPQIPIELGDCIDARGEPPIAVNPPNAKEKGGREKGQAEYLFKGESLSGGKSVYFHLRGHTNERFDIHDKAASAALVRYVRSDAPAVSVDSIVVGPPGQILLGGSRNTDVAKLAKELAALPPQGGAPFQGLTFDSKRSVNGERLYVNASGDIILQQDAQGFTWLNTDGYKALRMLNGRGYPVVDDTVASAHLRIDLSRKP